MWLIILYLIIIIATGAFTATHLLLSCSGKKPIKAVITTVLGIMSIALIVLTVCNNISLSSEGFPKNWIMLAVSLFFLWFWSKKRSYESFRLKLAAGLLAACLFWISMLLSRADVPDSIPFLISVVSGVTFSALLLILNKSNHQKATAGHTLSVIQMALTIYYLIETSWSNTLSGSKPAGVNPDTALSLIPEAGIAIGISIIFSLGIISKLLKK